MGFLKWWERKYAALEDETVEAEIVRDAAEMGIVAQGTCPSCGLLINDLEGPGFIRRHINSEVHVQGIADKQERAKVQYAEQQRLLTRMEWERHQLWEEEREIERLRRELTEAMEEDQAWTEIEYDEGFGD